MSRRGVEMVLERALPLRPSSIPTTDAEELLLIIAEGYASDIEDLGDFLVEEASPRQWLSAIKARMAARERYLALLVEFGFVSRGAANELQRKSRASL